jgi:hypothetical protein
MHPSWRRLYAEPEYITAIFVGPIEGTMCATVDCTDYDHFRALPQVVSFQGTRMGKTGWNSDSHRACYQSNATLLKVG